MSEAPKPPEPRPEDLSADDLASPKSAGVDINLDVDAVPILNTPEPPVQAALDAPELTPPPPPPARPAAAPTPSAAPAKKLPEWKVLEPADRSDPCEHEVCEAKPGCPGWQIVAASVRGKLHAHKGSWREDSYAWTTADGWTIIAVSDGAGSSRLSRVASRVACETAVAQLKKLLVGYEVGPGDKQPPAGDLERLRSLLKDAGEKARHAVISESQRRKDPIKDFSATLLVVAHTAWQDRNLVAALQVGDGAIGMMTASGAKRLGISDHGEYSSETRFLTTPGIELEFHNRVIFGLPVGLAALALMTDGVSDDFYPEDQRIGEVFDSDPIADITAKAGGPVAGLLLSVAKEPRGGEALRDWLRYEKRGSSDDRTLVLMHRSPS